MSNGIKILVTLVIAALLFAITLILHGRSTDLTYFDNRVASTTREVVGNDPVQTLTLSRTLVSAAVLSGRHLEARTSEGDRHPLSTRISVQEPCFALDAINLDAGAHLLKHDSTITQLTISARQGSTPDVRASYRDGTTKVLTPDFKPEP